MSPVSTTATGYARPEPGAAVTSHTVHRPNKLAIGTMVWLSSEVMFFAGLFAMFFTLRAVVPDTWAAESEKLAVPFASVNTLILVISSFTCQFGVLAAERFQKSRTGGLLQMNKWGVIEWLTLTYVLGAVFVAGQIFEYAELVGHGVTPQSTPFGSAFYITTGFHALHVFGGLIAFLVTIARAFAAKRYGEHEATGTVCVSYYWHFVDVVWVVLYAMVYWLPAVNA
jgi:cytochrome c oxidase subunit III